MVQSTDVAAMCAPLNGHLIRVGGTLWKKDGHSVASTAPLRHNVNAAYIVLHLSEPCTRRIAKSTSSHLTRVMHHMLCQSPSGRFPRGRGIAATATLCHLSPTLGCVVLPTVVDTRRPPTPTPKCYRVIVQHPHRESKCHSKILKFYAEFCGEVPFKNFEIFCEKSGLTNNPIRCYEIRNGKYEMGVVQCFAGKLSTAVTGRLCVGGSVRLTCFRGIYGCVPKTEKR